jgi:hypothetical protein
MGLSSTPWKISKITVIARKTDEELCPLGIPNSDVQEIGVINGCIIYGLGSEYISLNKFKYDLSKAKAKT